ncbi:SDR family NAD(P)-dependent oxidoreductase [Rhizobium leguminosarum]|uniref:SDR family NAD(P)-dependent oxidoreductase n=1 Tax=Rhizobium leguminosarum TaxID=384 RepID=UPI001C93AE5D|nr:SDR family NAD(P)-dependent oxidoreductase [Rhizobium leguminosarum]MBY5775248.1 SDR family NAD(P)-dependent oxidoreductase [Rhizobium leguminosarum]
MQRGDNTLLITGGTRSIGRGRAERFHALGNRAIITARRQELLDDMATAHSGMIRIRADLRDAQSRAALYAQLPTITPSVNLLINNAGFESLLPGSTDFAVSRDIIKTNILSVLELRSRRAASSGISAHGSCGCSRSATLPHE